MHKKFLLLLSLFFVTSCSIDSESIKLNDLVIVYTSGLKEKSNLLILDKEQKIKYDLTINEMGIFDIKKDFNNNLILPVRYSNKIIKVGTQLNDQISEKEVLQFPLFYEEINNGKFIIYNYDEKGDIDFCTYEIRKGKKIIRERLRGLPRAVTIDKEIAYVYIDDNKKHYLEVIDLISGKSLSKITLDHGGSAGDIKKIDNKLIITTLSDSNLEHPDRYINSIDLSNDNKVEYQRLKNDSPNIIMFNDDYIFLTHWNSNKITILSKKTLSEQKQVNVDYPVIQARLINNKLYYLYQQEEGSGIDIFDVKKWEKIDSIKLPKKKDLLVQDFIIITS